MKTPLPLSSLAFALLIHAAPAAEQSLFDGNSLDGWSGGETWWRAEGGAITGEIPAGESLASNQFLFWGGELHDFDLRLRFRISGDPSANSGIQFRCKPAEGGGAAGYQADIDGGAVWAGRIYDEHGRALIAERGNNVIIGADGTRAVHQFRHPADYAAIAPAGQWHDYRIQAVGPRIRCWLNGHLAADLTDNQIGEQDFAGKLAIQLHSGPGPAKIEVTDIRLTDLGATPLPQANPDAPQPGRGGISPEGRNLGFEDGTLRGWQADGDVWDGSPIEGDTVTPRRPGQASDHDGRFWVGGYERTKSDAGKGTLTSEPFKVTHPWGSFLVAGGKGDDTRVEIALAGGEVIMKASGAELENLKPVAVDLRAHLGKDIVLRVVDETAGFWGHVNYDDFRFHDEKPQFAARRVLSNPILSQLSPNPSPKDADETVAGMWVPPGFRVDLIAKEPDITQPIAFAIDARSPPVGRRRSPAIRSASRVGRGQDRIAIFEDADGDGSFEKKTIFAEGLNLVSGIEVGFGGVWVGAAPELLFIPDKDGDDQPDGPPVALLDGFGYQDTHETLNSFAWGPDGWLYGNQGVFNRSAVGKPGAPESERTIINAAVWRYHPVRHEFEVFARGGSNQWGIDFNEEGNTFSSPTAAARGAVDLHVRRKGRYYWNQNNANHAPFVAAGNAGYNPGGAAPLLNFLRSSARYGLHGRRRCRAAGVARSTAGTRTSARCSTSATTEPRTTATNSSPTTCCAPDEPADEPPLRQRLRDDPAWHRRPPRPRPALHRRGPPIRTRRLGLHDRLV
ncbi:MAG: family 16 glycoside hydrolase [Verrucomicrobiales bacterium]